MRTYEGLRRDNAAAPGALEQVFHDSVAMKRVQKSRNTYWSNMATAEDRLLRFKCTGCFKTWFTL